MYQVIQCVSVIHSIYLFLEAFFKLWVDINMPAGMNEAKWYHKLA